MMVCVNWNMQQNVIWHYSAALDGVFRCLHADIFNPLWHEFKNSVVAEMELLHLEPFLFSLIYRSDFLARARTHTHTHTRYFFLVLHLGPPFALPGNLYLFWDHRKKPSGWWRCLCSRLPTPCLLWYSRLVSFEPCKPGQSTGYKWKLTLPQLMWSEWLEWGECKCAGGCSVRAWGRWGDVNP